MWYLILASAFIFISFASLLGGYYFSLYRDLRGENQTNCSFKNKQHFPLSSVFSSFPYPSFLSQEGNVPILVSNLSSIKADQNRYLYISDAQVNHFLHNQKRYETLGTYTFLFKVHLSLMEEVVVSCSKENKSFACVQLLPLVNASSLHKKRATETSGNREKQSKGNCVLRYCVLF
jgi:hypothetical protein